MGQYRMDGFQKPIHVMPRKAGKSSTLARITEAESEDGSRHGAECSCGWVKTHSRKKVVTEAVDAHVKKKHKRGAIFL